MGRRTDPGFAAYLDSLDGYPLLSPDEERVLFARLADPSLSGDEWLAVRNRIVECNLRLVVFSAKAMARRMRCDVDEMISPGNQALIRAVERFDLSRGLKFSTYAMRCVVTSLMRWKNGEEDTPVRVPMHVVEFLAAERRARGVPARARAEIPYAEHGRNGRVRADFATATATIAADKGRLGPVESTLRDWRAEKLWQALESMGGGREVEVLMRRYGLGDRPMETLTAIGQSMGVTRERTRQIQESAEKRLVKKLKKLGIEGLEVTS